jgi:3-deoxy-manno-octulosonate cytidylyltransferase (CMP-KDO synthetase)
MKRVLGVIPARHASSRFPGKPLADIGGKSMVQRVYEQVKKSTKIRQVVVATDHLAIHDHVLAFGGEACMTKGSHHTGTDRCYEALTQQKESFHYVINIQGDEPFIQPDQIDLLADQLDGNTEIATLIKRIELEDELSNTGEVKVVKDMNNTALYFSRAAIPHLRHISRDKWLSHHAFYKHIGLYAYRSDILKSITALPVSSLEQAESLEQLRWLENGYRITVVETETESLCIETPEDLDRAREYLKNFA